MSCLACLRLGKCNNMRDVICLQHNTTHMIPFIFPFLMQQPYNNAWILLLFHFKCINNISERVHECHVEI